MRMILVWAPAIVALIIAFSAMSSVDKLKKRVERLEAALRGNGVLPETPAVLQTPEPPAQS